MKILNILICTTALILFSSNAFAQPKKKPKVVPKPATTPMTTSTPTPIPTPTPTPTANVNAIKNSVAYSEVLLRKTELEATVDDLLVRYTNEYPRVKETRQQLNFIKDALAKLLTANPNDAPKLTSSLAKLIIRKAELDAELWTLRFRYGDEHEEVKSAARKVATFDKAIKEILP